MKWMLGVVLFSLLAVPAAKGEDAKCFNLEAAVKAIRAQVKAGRKVEAKLIDVGRTEGPKQLPAAWIRANGPSVLKDAILAAWISKPEIPVTQNGCKSVLSGFDFVIHSSTLNEIELGLDVEKLVAKMEQSLRDQLVELKKPLEVKPKAGEKFDDFVDRAAELAADRVLEIASVELSLVALKDRKRIAESLDTYRMKVQREGEEAIKVTQVNNYGTEESGFARLETVTMIRWGKDPVEDKISAEAERFQELTKK